MFIFTLNKVSRVSWRSLRCDVTDRDSPSLPQTSHGKREERTARRETRLEQGMRVCRIKKFCLLSPRVAPKLRVGYTAKGQRGLRERVCPETNSTIKRHGHEISYQMLYALKRTLELQHHIMVETSSEKKVHKDLDFNSFSSFSVSEHSALFVQHSIWQCGNSSRCQQTFHSRANSACF